MGRCSLFKGDIGRNKFSRLCKGSNVSRCIDVVIFSLGRVEDNDPLGLIDSTVDLVRSCSGDETCVTCCGGGEGEESIEIVDVKSLVNLGDRDENSVDEVILDGANILSVYRIAVEECEDRFDFLCNTEDIDFIESEREERTNLLRCDLVKVHSEHDVHYFFLLWNMLAIVLLKLSDFHARFFVLRAFQGV